MNIFKSLVQEPDLELEWEFIDESMVKAHPHSAGAARAARYDKLKRSYVSMVAMACGFTWLPM